MIKSDIVNEVAKLVGTKNKAQVIVNCIFTNIGDALKRKDSYTISGFGSFKVIRRNARMGINPQTGEAIKIKAMDVCKFAEPQWAEVEPDHFAMCHLYESCRTDGL